ncbi:tetratricopeptide repeat protein [Maribacter vaceletii]|uniref:Tetratricopeptide repeat protein n=1 Tax=Maribacter vaceletii TaxID=1206816 RepID=A0A495EBX1_9FLAO|nr:tetratricopeptide repeat protein [Maribacter vaceletii]RKR14388.1 tetratricopeptide repeat protein [Maribacter vaceletii]
MSIGLKYTKVIWLNFFIIFFLCCIFFSSNIKAQKPYNTNEYIDKVHLLIGKNNDSAFFYLKKGIEYYSRERDTVNLVYTICELSNYYSHNLDYGNAYEGHWEALILADKSNNEKLKPKIYQGLGWLYLYFRRDEEALKYFKLALSLNKQLLKEKKIHESLLLSDYFALINYYRTRGNLKKASEYLDSAIAIQNRLGTGSFYLVSELGYVKGFSGEYEKGIALLDKAADYFKENNPSYMIIINYLYGQVHEKNGQLNKSIEAYKKTLALTDDYNRHSNYILKGNESLANIYSEQQEYEKAYYHRNIAANVNEKIFGRTSEHNSHLFEINDKYRLQKENEKALQKERHIEKLEDEKRIGFLKNILMGVVVLFILLYSVLFFRNLRRKHRLEKETLLEKRRLEKQKTREVMELKNRELTASALQLIEKEEFIIKLKQSISKSDTIDVRTINRMLKGIQSSPGSNWKEFEARFTSINQSFYKKIRDNFPDLGQTDLKLCALVKLDFSSKEMSSLLGITIESVHTSRHRLRKKLQLKRGENLVDFIATF